MTNFMRLFSVAVVSFTLAWGSLASASSKVLKEKMGIIGEQFKQLNKDFGDLKDAGGGTDAQWAALKAKADLMATKSAECVKEFPDKIIGDTAKEKDFSERLADVNKAIVEKLVKALEQKEIDDTTSAIALVVKKRNAAHAIFNPPPPKPK